MFIINRFSLKNHLGGGLSKLLQEVVSSALKTMRNSIKAMVKSIQIYGLPMFIYFFIAVLIFVLSILSLNAELTNSDGQSIVTVIKKVETIDSRGLVSGIQGLNHILILIISVCLILFSIKYHIQKGKVNSIKKRNLRKWIVLFSSSYFIMILFTLVWYFFSLSRIVSFIYINPLLLSMYFLVAGYLSYNAPLNKPVTKNYPSNHELNKDKYLRHLFLLMENTEMSSDSNISKSLIANKLGITENLLTTIIFENFGLSYTKFINKFRIEKAKKILLNNECIKYTVEAIGFEVGFGTRASFYNAFNEFVNMTPGQYRTKVKTERQNL